VKITVPPVAQTEVVPVAGTAQGTAQLSVTAVGDGALQYRWFKDGVALSGATLSSVNVAATDTTALYSVQVTGNAGSLSLGSDDTLKVPVAVKLMTLPSVTSQPVDASATAGSSLSLTAQGSGGGTLSYQWQRYRGGIWTAVTGATTTTLTLNPVRPSDSGAYRLVVSNARDKAESQLANVAVRELDVISTQPVAQVVNPGDAAVFSVVAKGLDLSYQWRKNGVSIAGIRRLNCECSRMRRTRRRRIRRPVRERMM